MPSSHFCPRGCVTMNNKIRISLIAAMSQNGVIGKNNMLPWHIPEELKYFRKVTEGKPIIMGRKTFESLNSKPLPNRHNIILTQDSHFSATGVSVVHSVQEALDCAVGSEDAAHAEHAANTTQLQEVMVIGGASVFQAFLPLATRIYLTVIHEEYEGDTFFPALDWAQWQLTSEENKGQFTVKVFDKI
jgi:dihydrofolate reductase